MGGAGRGHSIAKYTCADQVDIINGITNGLLLVLLMLAHALHALHGRCTIICPVGMPSAVMHVAALLGGVEHGAPLTCAADVALRRSMLRHMTRHVPVGENLARWGKTQLQAHII
jgi:hypothetical protein